MFARIRPPLKVSRGDVGTRGSAEEDLDVGREPSPVPNVEAFMDEGWSVRSWLPAVLASGVGFALACGGPSAPAAPQALSFSEPPKPYDAPRPTPEILAAEGELACDDGNVEHQFLPVECNPACTAHTTVIRRCVAGGWNEERLEADCAPCPTAITTSLVGCELEHTTLKPSELSARDGCVLRLHCGSTEVQTECDGENDGTNTSLCECERDGVRDAHVLKDPYQGEGPESCLAAAVHCKAPRKKSPKLAN